LRRRPRVSWNRTTPTSLERGTHHFNDRFSAIDCTIRSLGDDGVQIDVWNAHDLPEKFTLITAPENAQFASRR
jgi:hypothetical protein